MNKAIGTAEIDKSLEAEIRRSLHQSRRTTAVPRPASVEREVMADNLGTLFSRMTKFSVSEVEALIDELQMVRKKLVADGDLIERAIARHSEHSHGVMELTTIIADNVKRLPSPTS